MARASERDHRRTAGGRTESAARELRAGVMESPDHAMAFTALLTIWLPLLLKNWRCYPAPAAHQLAAGERPVAVGAAGSDSSRQGSDGVRAHPIRLRNSMSFATPFRSSHAASSGRWPPIDDAGEFPRLCRVKLHRRGIGARSQARSARIGSSDAVTAAAIGIVLDPVCRSGGQHPGRSIIAPS